MYEIAVRELPHSSAIDEFKMKHGKRGAQELMREIARGDRRPDLSRKRTECRRYGVGGAFKKRECCVFYFQLVLLKAIQERETHRPDHLQQSSITVQSMSQRSAQTCLGS